MKSILYVCVCILICSSQVSPTAVELPWVGWEEIVRAIMRFSYGVLEGLGTKYGSDSISGCIENNYELWPEVVDAFSNLSNLTQIRSVVEKGERTMYSCAGGIGMGRELLEKMGYIGKDVKAYWLGWLFSVPAVWTNIYYVMYIDLWARDFQTIGVDVGKSLESLLVPYYLSPCGVGGIRLGNSIPPILNMSFNASTLILLFWETGGFLHECEDALYPGVAFLLSNLVWGNWTGSTLSVVHPIHSRVYGSLGDTNRNNVTLFLEGVGEGMGVPMKEENFLGCVLGGINLWNDMVDLNFRTLTLYKSMLYIDQFSYTLGVCAGDLLLLQDYIQGVSDILKSIKLLEENLAVTLFDIVINVVLTFEGAFIEDWEKMGRGIGMVVKLLSLRFSDTLCGGRVDYIRAGGEGFVFYLWGIIDAITYCQGHILSALIYYLY